MHSSIQAAPRDLPASSPPPLYVRNHLNCGYPGFVNLRTKSEPKLGGPSDASQSMPESGVTSAYFHQFPLAIWRIINVQVA